MGLAAHIELFKEVVFIVEMNISELENLPIDELYEFKTQLNNVRRRIKTDRKRFDKKKSFYRDSGLRMNDLKEKIDEIKNIIKKKEKLFKITNPENINIQSFIDKQSKTFYPFKNEDTSNLFKFIVDKWDYSFGQKWADIWNELHFSDDYTSPYKNEYQSFIIKNYNYTGKFQYDKIKKPENPNRIQLIKIIEEYKQNRPN